jgi:hypothetical protein
LHEPGLPSALHRHVQPESHDSFVGQDNDGQLMLTVGSQPTYKLRSYQGRTFVIDELESFRVEVHLGPDGKVDELFFHQPNGTFLGRRA